MIKITMNRHNRATELSIDGQPVTSCYAIDFHSDMSGAPVVVFSCYAKDIEIEADGIAVVRMKKIEKHDARIPGKTYERRNT